MITGIVGLRFLFLRAAKPLRDNWNDDLTLMKMKPILRDLWQGLKLLLLVQGLLVILQVLKSGFEPGSLTLTLTSYLRLLGKQGFYGSFLILTFILIAKKERASQRSFSRWLAIGLLLSVVSLIIYMLFQRYWGLDWVHGLNARLGEHRFAYGVYRASGFMGHPLSLAYNGMLLALFSCGQGLWLWRNKRPDAWAWLGLSALCLLLIELSGSRYPLALSIFLIGGAISGTLVSTSKNKWRALLSLFALSFLGLWAVLLVDQNLWGRILELVDSQIPMESRFDRWVFWKIHLKIFLDHPFLGTGLANYDRLLLDYYDQAGYTHIERKYAAHNIFLQTFADSGLSGALVLLVIFAVWFRAAARTNLAFRHPGLLLLWWGTLLGGIMQNNLRDSEFLYAVWASIGLSCGCILASGVHFESNCRSHFQDHQS